MIRIEWLRGGEVGTVYRYGTAIGEVAKVDAETVEAVFRVHRTHVNIIHSRFGVEQRIDNECRALEREELP